MGQISMEIMRLPPPGSLLSGNQQTAPLPKSFALNNSRVIDFVLKQGSFSRMACRVLYDYG